MAVKEQAGNQVLSQKAGSASHQNPHLPHFPGSSRTPQFFQQQVILHRIHGLPEARVSVAHQLALFREGGQHARFQLDLIAVGE